MWLARLRHAGHDRDLAIQQLRDVLVAGLARALHGRYGNDVIVEDVAQESLLRILNSLDSFEGRSRFTTWAIAIAVRVGISELRKRHYRQVSLDAMDDQTLGFEVPSSDVPFDDRSRLLNLLREAIDQELSARQKIAIRALLEGLPVEEIAVRMNSNRNATYKLIHDARLKLRVCLEARGVTSTDITVPT